MNVTPHNIIYSKNEILLQYPLFIYESALQQYDQIIFDGYVSQSAVLDPLIGITYVVPANTLLQNTKTYVKIGCLSEIVAIDTTAEGRKIPVKVQCFGNVPSGVNPINVDGSPIYTGLNKTQDTLVYNQQISSVRVTALEILFAVNFINFQTTSVFTPDLTSTDWKTRSYLTLCIFQQYGTH